MLVLMKKVNIYAVPQVSGDKRLVVDRGKVLVDTDTSLPFIQVFERSTQMPLMKIVIDQIKTKKMNIVRQSRTSSFEKGQTTLTLKTPIFASLLATGAIIIRMDKEDNLCFNEAIDLVSG